MGCHENRTPYDDIHQHPLPLDTPVTVLDESLWQLRERCCVEPEDSEALDVVEAELLGLRAENTRLIGLPSVMRLKLLESKLGRVEALAIDWITRGHRSDMTFEDAGYDLQSALKGEP